MDGRGPGKSGTLLTNVENNRQAWQYTISAATAGTPRWVKVATMKHPNPEPAIKIPRGTKFLAYARDSSVDPYNFVVTENVIALRDTSAPEGVNRYLPIVQFTKSRI
ncbi:hypothetical protein vBKpnAMK6_00459 [Klebsiella phage vB_Kpn_AM_K6]